MKVYHSISDFQNVSRPILTTGTFDGVHFGHKIIIDRLKEIAKNQNGETVLLTFSPHPRMVLFPDDHNLQLINTLEEKIKLLEQAGIDHLIIHPFTKSFSRTTSLQFIRDIIVNEPNTTNSLLVTTTILVEIEKVLLSTLRSMLHYTVLRWKKFQPN